MNRRDWLALVAVHSDSWLVSVAFYYAARLNRNDRYHTIPPNFASSVSQGPMLALLRSLVACSLLLCCLCSLTHMTCIHVLGLSREYSL
jgi:hypothetical protein